MAGVLSGRRALGAAIEPAPMQRILEPLTLKYLHTSLKDKLGKHEMVRALETPAPKRGNRQAQDRA